MAARRRHSFTLIEILTVIAIMFALVAMIVALNTVVGTSSAEAKTKARLQTMMMALQQHYQDRGYYPQATTPVDVDFDAAPFNDLKHSQTGVPYMEGELSGLYVDGWKEPFRYELHSTEGYRLWSKGNDKVAGTEDDIASWKIQ